MERKRRLAIRKACDEINRGLSNKPRLVDKLPHPVLIGAGAAVLATMIYQLVRWVR